MPFECKKFCFYKISIAIKVSLRAIEKQFSEIKALDFTDRTIKDKPVVRNCIDKFCNLFLADRLEDSKRVREKMLSSEECQLIDLIEEKAHAFVEQILKILFPDLNNPPQQFLEPSPSKGNLMLQQLWRAKLAQ